MSAHAPGSRFATLMPAAQAGKLLDEIVYARLLETIDLDELYRFEEDLCISLSECGIAETGVHEIAKEMIDAALGRLIDEPRRYSRMLTQAEYEAELRDCDRIEREFHARRARDAKTT